MKTLYILRGLPGSGKSTLAERLKVGQEWVYHFEADMWFYDKDGKYNFDATKLREAHLWCQTGVDDKMSSGYDVIVSNTFTTEKELQPYYDAAKNHNYKVVSLVVENRHNGKSIHDVPEETLDKMEKRFTLKLK